MNHQDTKTTRQHTVITRLACLAEARRRQVRVIHFKARAYSEMDHPHKAGDDDFFMISWRLRALVVNGRKETSCS